MVFAWILISLPFTGLRPARALRVRGRKVPKPTTVTRLPFATLLTIASNTAFTASFAATLLTLPAFAATWTRSDLVTTGGIDLPLTCVPRLRARILSKPKSKDNARVVTCCDFAHAAGQTFMIQVRGGRHEKAFVTGARCARPARAGANHAHVFVLGAAVAPSHGLASQLDRGSRKGDRRARQVQPAAQASVGPARNVRRGARRADGPLLRDRELYARAPCAAADARAARRRRYLGSQLDRLLAHPLEALPQGRRVQGREAAWRLYPRPGADVHQEAGGQHQRHQGFEDSHGRRRGGSGGQRPRRLGVRQARARVLRAAEVRRRRRRVLPARVDRVLQARHSA